MIKDRLENAEIYYPVSENLKKGLEWLKSTDLKTVENGKYEIDGENLYANVQEYTTKDDGKYEAHRKYIDIQYLISGTEKVGVCDLSFCSTTDKYNPETDLEFLNSSKKDEWQILNEGEFLILFPNDAHKPSIKAEQNTTVKKVVVKVGIN